MDDFELSSVCSESSKNSELLCSDVSTLSGVGEYESEFLGLKQLVNANQDTSEKYNVEKNDVIDLYQEQITILSTRMKNPLKQNEECKKTTNHLKKESHIISHERTEKLLQQNKQLRDNLEIANRQIQRLFNIYATDDQHKTSDGHKLTIWNLEKRNYELSRQNQLMSEKINQRSSHIKEIEKEYEILKGEVNDLKLDLSASENCVKVLKKKISEQHVELQRLSENNTQLTHSLDLMSSELQYKNKTERWYKEQLNEQQKQKTVLQEISLQNETSLATKDKKIECLTLEVNKWKHNCNDLQLTVSRQKEKLLKQSENINKPVTRTEHPDVNNDIEKISSYYTTVIDDLNEDIKRIKLELDSQRDHLNMVLEEKSNLLTNCLSLQNCVREKENYVEYLQSTMTELTQKIDILSKDNLKQKFKLSDASKACTKLKAEVEVKNRDKEIVEESIEVIKKQFKIFKTKYARLRDELSLKNREYTLLSNENYKTQMDNNNKICSLEHSIKEYLIEIENLKTEISSLEHNKNRNESQSCGHLEEIETLNKEILKLQKNFKKVQTDFLNLLALLPDQQSTPVYEKDNNLLNTIPDSTENTTFLDLLRHISKLCFVDEDFITSIQQCDFNLTDKQKNYFKIILNAILMRLRSAERETVTKDNQLLEFKKKINNLKLDCKSRIQKLENRYGNLFEKIENNVRIIELLSHTDLTKTNNEIKRLRTSLEVKVQEAKETRKRYERNYRTLLKKVKEHMKGRSAAEKHNAYLQELNSILSEETNALRLQLDSMSDISNLQFGTDKKNRCNEELPNFEQVLPEDFSKCNTLENDNKRLKKENQELLSELYSSKILIESIESKIMSYTSTNEALRSQVKELDTVLEEERLQKKHFEIQMTTMKQQISDLCSGNSQMNEKLLTIEDRELYLQEQIKNLNLCITEKTNEIIDLNNKKHYFEKKWLEKEKNMVILITNLKRQINEFKLDIDRMKNEKFFLQRLCNDLKVALTIHVTHNKALKEYLNNASKHVNSSILSKFPSPTKSNDARIKKLLEQSTEQEKSPSGILEGMDSLKTQITFLQNIICAKSFGHYDM